MNYIVLGLAIVVIVLIVILYLNSSKSSTTLSANASLVVSPPKIPVTDNATSTRYAYSIWININSWDNTKSSNNIIFSVPDSLLLFLDESAPILYCSVVMANSTVAVIQITDNFPLQKWTHVIVSMDSEIMDIYMNGKLTMSQRLYITDGKVIPNKPWGGSSEAEHSLYLGRMVNTLSGIDAKLLNGVPKKSIDSFDAYIAKFYRWSIPMNPDTAWSTYRSGSGSSYSSGGTGGYNINMGILKNNVQTSTFSIF
jgi:hypothetical protein